MSAEDPMSLTPEGFEQFVRSLLDQEGAGLQDYRSNHLETIPAPDGDYTFDVTARFSALGADFLVVVECKRWSSPIERELVQTLEQKRQSVSAQKAILVTTSEFRSGAVDFAAAHRIALVVIEHGGSTYINKSLGGKRSHGGPPLAAWMISRRNGGTTRSVLGSSEDRWGKHESQGFLLEFLRKESSKT